MLLKIRNLSTPVN